MEIVGRQIEVGLATEATRGTAETTADRWLRKVTADITERATHVVDDTTRGRLEDGENRRVVQKYVEGNLEGIIHADGLGWLFCNIFGRVETSTVSGSVKEHSFTMRQNIEHQSLSLFVKDGGVQQKVFSNAMINTLEITAAVDDYVRFAAEFQAAEATDNASTPSYGTDYDFIGRDITVEAAPTYADIENGDGQALKIKDLSITFDQGLVRDHVLGSYVPDDIYNPRLMVEGTMTLNFDDVNGPKQSYLTDDSSALRITIEGAADIGSGEHPKLVIALPKIQIMDWNRGGGANELVTQEVSFRAFLTPLGEGEYHLAAVNITNLTASYVNVPSN